MEPIFIRPVMGRYLSNRTQRDQPPSQPVERTPADEIPSSFQQPSLLSVARRATGSLLISIGERLQGRPHPA